MATYLFVTKPEFSPESVKSSEWDTWSCSSTTMAGDRALVYLTGTGIVYEWEVTEDRWPDEEWHFACGVKYLRSLEPAITCAELKEEFSKADWPAPHTNFRGFKSVLIPETVASRIRSMRQDVLRNPATPRQIRFPVKRQTLPVTGPIRPTSSNEARPAEDIAPPQTRKTEASVDGESSDAQRPMFHPAQNSGPSASAEFAALLSAVYGSDGRIEITRRALLGSFGYKWHRESSRD